MCFADITNILNERDDASRTMRMVWMEKNAHHEHYQGFTWKKMIVANIYACIYFMPDTLFLFTFFSNKKFFNFLFFKYISVQVIDVSTDEIISCFNEFHTGMKMYVHLASKIFPIIRTLSLNYILKSYRYRIKFIKNLIFLFMS